MSVWLRVYVSPPDQSEYDRDLKFCTDFLKICLKTVFFSQWYNYYDTYLIISSLWRFASSKIVVFPIFLQKHCDINHYALNLVFIRLKNK